MPGLRGRFRPIIHRTINRNEIALVLTVAVAITGLVYTVDVSNRTNRTEAAAVAKCYAAMQLGAQSNGQSQIRQQP